MNESLHIYRIKVSRFKERPKLDLNHPKYSGANDWDNILAIEDGELGLEEYIPLVYYTDDPGALEWDAYYPALKLGLISPRAKEIIQPFADQYFIFLEASLNDNLYFVLIVNESLDCLDRERSEFMTFADFALSDPEDDMPITESDYYRIMEISKYRFKKELIPDPCMFSERSLIHPLLLSQSSNCFAIDGVRHRIFRLLARLIYDESLGLAHLMSNF